MTSTQTDGRTSGAKTGWTARLARHRTGLAALSFGESTIIPIPLETVVIPLMIGHPKRSLSIATAIWIGCIAGAAVLYAVGFWLAEPVVEPLLATLNLSDDFREMQRELEGGSLFWTVFIVSFSPVPMQIATLGAGTIGGNIVTTFAAIALSRGLRYFGLALLAQLLGERVAKLNIPTGKLVLGTAAIILLGWGIMQLAGL